MKKLLLAPFVLALALGNPWTARRYVAADPLRNTAVIVPLRGSAAEERMRLEEAAELVRKGHAPTLLVSVSGALYYGRPVRTMVETYLEGKGFPARKLKFCENAADSTIEEARALLTCLRQLGAREVLIVTSEYHSRRARFLFRRALKGTGIVALVHPVYNREYWDPYWWKRRRWAKTFFIESLAWIGNSAEQAGLWVREIIIR